ATRGLGVDDHAAPSAAGGGGTLALQARAGRALGAPLLRGLLALLRGLLAGLAFAAARLLLRRLRLGRRALAVGLGRRPGRGLRGRRSLRFLGAVAAAVEHAQ